MSKKDYQAIAGAIYGALGPKCEACNAPFVGLSGGVKGCPVHGIRTDRNDGARGALLGRLLPVLVADNAAFDRKRFIEACETGKTKGMKAVTLG